MFLSSRLATPSARPRRNHVAHRRLVEPLEGRTLFDAILPDGFSDTEVATGFFSPTAMAIANDGSNRIFVTEQTGDVRVVKNGQLLTAPFVHLNVTSSGEHGLLGITFDPDFANNHYIYVYYTTAGTPFHNRLSRFTANGDVAAAGSEQVLLDTQDLDSSQLFHDGGCLRFGPDGKLYVSTGENQHPENSQSLSNLQGKILRINPDGSIPTDNPFYDTATGINRLIWAYGFRNPFKFDFQPGTGLLYINDVGQDLFEEINEGAAGGNFGWPNQEGQQGIGTGYVDPLYYYNHVDACAITGGVFYPIDGSFPEQYRGKYFFNDLCGGWIRMMDTSTHEVTGFATNLPGPVDMAVGSDGALYYLARQHEDDTQDNSGFISVIRQTAGQAPTITTQPVDHTVAAGTSVTFTVSAGGQSPLSYQWQRNGQDIAGATSASYTISAASLTDNGAAYRVRISNPVGQIFSNAATLTVIDDAPPAASIRLPAAGTSFFAGQTFTYYGKATDSEDGELGASAFTWQVDYHTGTVIRPFIQPRSGVTKGSFTIPTITPYTRSNVFYRVILTVTDSSGISTTVTRDITPRTANVTVRTNVAGLQVVLDGQPVVGPTSFEGVIGIARQIGVEPTQTLNGKTYVFDHWSDGGDVNHEISTPAANKTYTANFVLATTKGVRATYFNNKTFSGTQITRIDNNIDFDWAAGSPDASIARDTFSARWTGKFQPIASGDYTFSLVTDGGVRLRVGGQVVINQLTPANALHTVSGTIHLDAGAKVPIVLEYIHDTGAARVQLNYSVNGGAETVVPRSQLYTPVPAVTTLAPIADAFVQGGSSANKNFGASPTLAAKSYKTADAQREIYLRFDFSAVQAISDARLRVFGALSGIENANVPLGLYTAGKASWSEDSITFNNRPVVGSLIAQALVSTSTTQQWYEFDLTDFLKSLKAQGVGAVTLVLKNIQNTTTTTQLNSRQAASNQPQLVVTS